jgi:peptidyl-prolyl cis-trans isomerase A (cyclophilin A)
LKIAPLTLRLFAPAALLCALTASAQTAPAPLPDLPDAPSTSAHLAAPATPTGPTALIDTTMGRLTCRLFDKEAPQTVANFIGLATATKPWIDSTTQAKKRTRFFDGLIFHRVIPSFMIQGGDPEGTGMGDPGYFFDDEIVPSLTFDVPGRLAMANSGPNTNGSQFFVTEVPVPELNGKHTIFGQCDDASVAVVAAIARVPRDGNDRPRTPVTITRVTIIPVGEPIPPAPAIAPPTPTPASN